MKRILPVLFFATILFTACDYGYGQGGDLPPGHHDRADQYGWYISYDDGTAVREYYTDSQPLFDSAKADLELENVREATGGQLTDTIHDTFSLPVDEYSIIRVVKQPMRNHSVDVNDFEWRLVFVDAAGNHAEFYLHHPPEELWPSGNAARVMHMVRGMVRVGNDAMLWSFSEYYLAGPASFFLVEQRPGGGWD